MKKVKAEKEGSSKMGVLELQKNVKRASLTFYFCVDFRSTFVKPFSQRFQRFDTLTGNWGWS